MKKKHIILVAVVAFLLVVYGINVHNMRTRPRPAQTPETVTVTMQRTPKPARKEDLDAVYHVADVMRENMPESEVHMEYDPEAQIVYYRISRQDLSPEIIELTKVTPSMKEAWDDMVDGMISMQKQASAYFERAGVLDMITVVQILNPDNTDEVWLSVANGIAGYDVVNGIDLLNDQS